MGSATPANNSRGEECNNLEAEFDDEAVGGLTERFLSNRRTSSSSKETYGMKIKGFLEFLKKKSEWHAVYVVPIPT